eukprot:GEMP01072383.1.p1 GENE.GEMP01072383.1~~GEMP01072383.1.p1  ORF type:complete len:256 (+),score=42.40 GEMP01072383.1:196-963(+)
MVSGLDLLHADSVTVPLSTGLATLDNLLGGGLRHEIVELAGAPQSGKTQLIFTIIANLLRRDPSAEVFLITAAPPVQVVQQLRQLLVTKDLLERVRIEHVARIPELWSLLIDPFWKLDGTRTDQAPSAPLLCIDGMFTLFAPSTMRNDRNYRVWWKMLMDTTRHLRRISRYRAVLCTNRLVQQPDADSKPRLGLGKAWTFVADTRLQLDYSAAGVLRVVRTKSPTDEIENIPDQCELAISAHGVIAHAFLPLGYG